MKTVLLVEDNSDDAFLLQKALLSAGVHHFSRVVGDGQAAIDYLAGNGPYQNRKKYPLPMLVFLDIKLPKLDGLEVLRWLRSQPAFKMLPVIMLTNSCLSADVKRAQDLGVTSYMLKDPDWQRFRESIEHALSYWFEEQPIERA